jgi:hypothetical protein
VEIIMAEGEAKLFLMILTMFAIWTGVIGIVNMAGSGTISINDMAALSGPIPGQVMPAIGTIQSLDTGNSLVYSQDFTNSTGYSLNVTSKKGSWSQSNGIGYTCTGVPLLPLFEPAELYPINAVSTNNVYEIHYQITNPNPNDDFYIVLSLGGNPETFLRFEPAGIHLSKLAKISLLNFPMNDHEFFPYVGANTLSDIRVLYNPVLGTAEVIINEQESIHTFTDTGTPITGAILANGGVATYHPGLVVKSMTGQFMTQSEGDANWITLLINAVKTIISAVVGFGNLISQIIGLSGQQTVPVWIWAIFGLPAIATLAYMAFKLWRGSP